MTERWLETLHDAYGQTLTVDKIYFESKTEHQHLMIFDNAMFGRVMVLDGVVQTTEKDEFIYHEMLTHVPLLSHGAAKRVLIIGGGDGGMLREVCRHSTVEHVTQVEIDQAVIDMCREYLPKHSNGAFDDPRVNIVIEDGIKFVTETDEKFDVIISDCTDPIGPGEVLFTSTFYDGCQRCLNTGGILVAQNGVVFMQPDEVSTTTRRLGSVFDDTTFYSAAIPTYIGGIMTFAWASDNPAYRHLDLETLRRRYQQANLQTRYYNPEIHQAAFALPQYVLNIIQQAETP
ncbi:MAG: polyamine aminopropyltransferase [Gammaproteobacteria bacterium]|jgi:spermidine synthase|nr:polyamine aminopropyltransferase [Gammaproteobacteria bacterium]